jgi:hypothetical protein
MSINTYRGLSADPYMAGYQARAEGLPFDSNTLPSWQCGWNDAAEDDRQGFTLRNEPAPKPKAKFESLGGRQRKLLDGLDCLPGQEDLF